MGEHRIVTDEKNPADRAVELLLFAPVGLALSARELLPQLVERGRQQVSGQVTMAKMLGQFAVKQGQVEAEKAFDRARTQAQEALEQLGVLDGGSSQTAPPTTPPSPPATATGPAAPASAASQRATVTPPPSGASPTPVPVRGAKRTATGPKAVASELAIPDYDSLSASQVLPRLSGLTPAELEAVGAHERANRGRKTILSKVAQLQGS